MKPQTYTPPQAAHILGVSLSTINRAIKTGELESHKIGRRRLIPIRAIEALLGRPVAEETGRTAPEGAEVIRLYDENRHLVDTFTDIDKARTALFRTFNGALRYNRRFHITEENSK